MRLVFAGTPDIAVPTLAGLLAAGHEIPLVLTQPDARGRRGSTLHPSSVKEYALEHGLSVMTPASARDEQLIDHVASLACDAAAVVAYGKILPPALIATVKHGWVNLHFSLLPAWRGAAPVQRAIMAGDQMTGATTFLIEEGLDTGPVVGTLTEPIESADTTGELLARLAAAGAPLMVHTMGALDDGTASPRQQSDDGASHAAKLSREDAYIRWDMPAHVIDRQVRGCTPAPGAWTTLPDGTVAKLGPVTVSEGSAGGAPGTVREHDGAVLVSTGSHPVALSWIAPAGKKPMDGADWWRGARVGAEDQLGEA